MTQEDKKMLESALWHISNSVTNGKSQTAECEITQWLRNKINFLSDEKPSDGLEEAAEEYSGKVAHLLNNAFKAGARWQKERDMGLLKTLYSDCDNLKKDLDKVTTGNLSHRIGNIKFSITGMQVLINKQCRVNKAITSSK